MPWKVILLHIITAKWYWHKVINYIPLLATLFIAAAPIMFIGIFTLWVDGNSAFFKCLLLFVGYSVVSFMLGTMLEVFDYEPRKYRYKDKCS